MQCDVYSFPLHVLPVCGETLSKPIQYPIESQTIETQADWRLTGSTVLSLIYCLFQTL